MAGRQSREDVSFGRVFGIWSDKLVYRQDRVQSFRDCLKHNRRKRVEACLGLFSSRYQSEILDIFRPMVPWGRLICIIVTV